MSLFVDHVGNPVDIGKIDKIEFGQHLPSAFDDGEPVEEPRTLKRTHSFVGGLSSADASASDPVLPIKPKRQPKSWDEWGEATVPPTCTRLVGLPSPVVVKGILKKDPRSKKLKLCFNDVSTFRMIPIVNTRLGVPETEEIFISPVKKTKTGEKIVLTEQRFDFEKCESGGRAEDS